MLSASLESIVRGDRSLKREFHQTRRRHALDNISFADDHVAIGNGFVLHPWRLYSHSADNGRRRGVDPYHSGPEADIAGCVQEHRLI